jgi:opacity protein-like surface antigen
MRKQLLLLTALGCSVCFSAFAGDFQQGTMAAEGRFGVAVPLGDFSDNYDSSFALGGSFLYGLNNVLALEGNLNYNTNFSCSYSGCDVDIFEFTGGARYLFPTNSLVVPYLGGGAGLYHIGGDNTDENDFGINYGGGVLVNLHPKIALDFSGRFNTVFADDTETYLSLTGGLVYFFSM